MTRNKWTTDESQSWFNSVTNYLMMGMHPFPFVRWTPSRLIASLGQVKDIIQHHTKIRDDDLREIHPFSAS
jgi:hypothetical protein